MVNTLDNRNQKLVAGATAYRRKDGRTQWLVVKEDEESGWELPKEIVRRAESSVRAALRSLQDNAGIRSRVLEEAGRATVSTTVNGEPATERLIFYLMRRRPGKLPGPKFAEQKWIPYSQAKRSLSLAREQRILRQANDTLKEWRKTKKGN